MNNFITYPEEKVGVGKVELPNGGVQWYFDGKLHREGKPAILFPNGDKFWYLHGKRHREDGYAIEGANGERECWTHGVRNKDMDLRLKYPTLMKAWNSNNMKQYEAIKVLLR